jgi:hypothetical protein
LGDANHLKLLIWTSLEALLFGLLSCTDVFPLLPFVYVIKYCTILFLFVGYEESEKTSLKDESLQQEIFNPIGCILSKVKLFTGTGYDTLVDLISAELYLLD